MEWFSGARSCTLPPLLLSIAAPYLLALDGFKECFDVAATKPPRALSLNDLVKEGRPWMHRLAKDLQKIAPLVAVNENAQAAQGLNLFRDVTDAGFEMIIISAGRRRELDASLAECPDRGDDVVGQEGDMMHATAAVVCEIFFYWRLALAG